MFAKLVIVILLIGAVISLFAGLFFLLRDTSQSRRTARALTVRVGFSVAIILFLLIAAKMGWIHPHGVGG